MEAGGMEALKVLEASLSQAKWRLKSASKRRLETDILALCTGIRPVIMVDYGGKMPELQERLCEVLKLSQQESSIYQHLRVMVIEDMIYLVHVQGLAKFVMSSLNSETKLLFVDLEQDPPKMITQTDESSVVMQLVSVQKLFSLAFPVDGMNSELLPCHGRDPTASDKSPISELVISQSSEFIDLSCCLQETQVTIPTLNGWLLGYPVVYLFSKERIAYAIYNLSTKSLHLFKVLVRRNGTFNKGYKEEELMSFSVPYDLSMGGSNEPWAEAFLAHMQAKWERCKQVWSSLHMEVSGCYPHAIVL
ncbi:uncharacterized protein LOC130750954 isoform X2 [Actinidia eriantha]|uniref:uncharacterized protein LOC130750954 isoform X2 n=1 Tax=Actinidia eriantha TaxID=165200 RepID=UPI0025858605|nr:uncharacterized protein LOC130750954 isoform X2 [Actinidia eriantha]